MCIDDVWLLARVSRWRILKDLKGLSLFVFVTQGSENPSDSHRLQTKRSLWERLRRNYAVIVRVFTRSELTGLSSRSRIKIKQASVTLKFCPEPRTCGSGGSELSLHRRNAAVVEIQPFHLKTSHDTFRRRTWWEENLWCHDHDFNLYFFSDSQILATFPVFFSSQNKYSS